ncbi:MAG: phosphate ABC transporter permease PstA, partial [Gammaproteobacteria bacterium]
MMKVSARQWFRQGHPWVWLNAGAVAISMTMVFGLLGFIAVKGVSHFWPKSLVEFDYTTPEGKVEPILGEFLDRETVSAERLRQTHVALASKVEFVERVQVKVGNRDVTGRDFRWVLNDYITAPRYPEQATVFERREWGNFYGYPIGILENGQPIPASPEDVWPMLSERLARALALHDSIRTIEVSEIGRVNYEIEKWRLKRKAHELNHTYTAERQVEFAAQQARFDTEYKTLQAQWRTLYQDIKLEALVVETVDGQHKVLEVGRLVRAYQPNNMSGWAKALLYVERLREFVFDEPREANTEGGVFPAIFGTVTMVMVMSIIVTPFGVVAAIYLREYATQGPLTRAIRIAVNNLAGVPSIVYGVFGLGFFVYAIGGSIDQVFYQESLPSPMFGTPGLLWAALTLALLTVPVVIVATEEGLARIPRAVREGSLALGATKAETLWRVVLPMASPAIMTGLILAIARAAGEVAPLMLVGVVKLAPN